MLKLIKVDKTFNPNTANEVVLYRDLNLTIEENEFVTVIGSNGSGKSTLFNIIGGAIMVDDGAIEFSGEDLTRVPEYRRAQRFARVYQDPLKGTAPSLTILENMSMADHKGKSFGLQAGVDVSRKQHYQDLLRDLDLHLEDKMDVAVGSLSGGQRQALSLVMATMDKPELLMLDEHTAALDPKTSELILALTKRLVRQQQGMTMMVTHNLKHALEVGNRLLMFHQGKIIMDVSGQEKSAMKVADLIERFNALNLTDTMGDELLIN